MRKFSLLLCACVMMWSALAGQNTHRTDIRGIVQDNDGNPLTGATVMLLAAKDSVLTSFAATGSDGAFALKNVPPNSYLLKITFVGFAMHTQALEIGDNPQVDLGKVVLAPAAELLNEVQVTAEHIPIQMKKDTIEYNADAYQTQPNAVVEDLLKKLPGVEVAADGSIKAQGEDVQNVYVDGKEFFGTDPKVATKNLPAKAVKKVKVYDKLSDMAEFSGIDDGDRQKSINLELKDDFKTGLFGTAEAGYGSDSKYLVKTNINKFTKTSQLSVLGLLNNVNEQGFTFQEYVNFSGGMRSFMQGGGGGARTVQIRAGGGVPISQGVGNGLIKTLAGGANYNFEVGKKFDVRSSYFYNGVNNDLLQTTFRQGYLNGSSYVTNEDDDQSSKNHNNRLNLRAKYSIDSTQNIELVSNATFGGGDGRSMQNQQTLDAENVLENTGITNNGQNSDRISFSGDLYYRKRLAKKGRTLTGNLSLDTRNDNGDSRLMAINEYLTTGNTDVLDQLQTSVANDMQWGGQVEYTEPIGKYQNLEVGYEYQHDNETSVRDASDIDSLGNHIPNPGLSTSFQRDLSIHKPGVTWRLNTEKMNLNVGVDFQETLLEGFVNNGEFPVRKELQNLLPAVRWRYALGTARNLRLDYRTTVNVPSVSQLSPVVDNSDPLNIYVGNPDLKAEYAHRVSLHFHSFSQFSFTSIFGMITGTLTKNKIVNATSVDEQFVETTSPVNIDNDYQLAGFGAFGTPIKFLKTRIQINANVQYNKSLIPINGVDNNLHRWTRTAGLQFQNQNSNVLDYTLGADWTLSTTKYSENTQQNQDFFTHHYFADLTVNFLKTWTINSSMDYSLYTGDLFDKNQALPIWKAYLSRYVMKDKRGQLKLSVFDLLNENKGLSRTSTANYIEEIRANSIGRYVMFSFLYSIKGFTQNDNNPGVRIFHH